MFCQRINWEGSCSPDMLKKGNDPELDPDPHGLDIKLRIRIRSKMFRIRNIALQGQLL
jgi:hypothetical protein